MSDERYAVGEICTWHGPLTFAAPVAVNHGDDHDQETYVCPKCALSLKVGSAEGFWMEVRKQQRLQGDYEDMMRWSEGKCYPDFDTLQNAWRQHIEGRL